MKVLFSLPCRSFLVLVFVIASSSFLLSQASYTAQIRGVVKDQTGAVIPNATVTITNDSTGISQSAHSDDHGLYVLPGLRPAVRGPLRPLRHAAFP